MSKLPPMTPTEFDPLIAKVERGTAFVYPGRVEFVADNSPVRETWSWGQAAPDGPPPANPPAA